MPALELMGLLAYGNADGFRQVPGTEFYGRWGMIPVDREKPDDNTLVMLLRQRQRGEPLPAEAIQKVDDLERSKGVPIASLIERLLADINTLRADEKKHITRWDAASTLSLIHI